MDFDRPPADPVAQCLTWFEEAAERTRRPNPRAMALATIDTDGTPSIRMVLLKGFDARGAVFFTNCTSRKGKAVLADPRAALLFHWDELDRQVRIEGAVSSVTEAEADTYFATRRRESRIGAWASDQSAPVADRATLDARVQAMTDRFEGVDVPRPPHWGGFRVSLDRVELWQGHPYRIHDRVVYTRRPDGTWHVERLCP